MYTYQCIIPISSLVHSALPIWIWPFRLSDLLRAEGPSRWRSNVVTNFFCPQCVVELNEEIVNLIVGAEFKDLDALDWRRTRIQDLAPPPDDLFAGVPDVQCVLLISAGRVLEVVCLGSSKVREGVGAVRLVGEEIDAVRFKRVVGVDDRCQKRVIDGALVPGEHLELREDVDDILSFGLSHTIDVVPFHDSTLDSRGGRR